MNNPLVQVDPGLFIWTILTFLVLLTLLAKFAWGPLLQALAAREETIRQSLADAEKARAEADGIIKNAERQIQLETARALEQIRHEAADLSVAIASKLIQKNITREDNERLIDDALKQLQ
jgi:F-type H+-transporting ATPase subunit b